MRKSSIPQLPIHRHMGSYYIQEGILEGYIWILDDKGARAIETQYANAQQIRDELGVSRATAYRIIAKQKKRYWCSDVRESEKPRCYSVIPREALKHITVLPQGNPNFSSGIYQQRIARKRSRRYA